MESINKLLIDRLKIKDDLLVRTFDALDVKASFGIVAITFLATQFAEIAGGPLPNLLYGLRLGSFVALAFGGFFAVVVLWPRDYLVPNAEGEVYSARIKEVTNYYKDHPPADGSVGAIESAIYGAILRDEIGWMKDRIVQNKMVNAKKLEMLHALFIAVAIAFACNMAILLLRPLA